MKKQINKTEEEEVGDFSIVNRVKSLNNCLSEMNLESELQNRELNKTNTNFKNILKIIKDNISELKDAKDDEFNIILWMIIMSLVILLLCYFFLL